MLLQLSGITLRRGVTILNNIHWGMEADQHWVILGSNGSGKTSLLNVLMGYEQPSSGRFMVFGSPFGTTPWYKVRNKIGIVSLAVSQKVEPEQMAQDIVIAGKHAQINSWTTPTEPQIAEAKRWLYLVGVEHLAERKWGVLSQGERQRIMIARALIIQPKLLILDEPCAGLDPVARETFMNFLQHVLTEELKIPTLLITHHVEEILPMFTHVLMMKSGQVNKAGTKEDVLTSQNLSETFNASIDLRKSKKRYFLKIQS